MMDGPSSIKNLLCMIWNDNEMTEQCHIRFRWRSVSCDTKPDPEWIIIIIIINAIMIYRQYIIHDLGNVVAKYSKINISPNFWQNWCNLGPDSTLFTFLVSLDLSAAFDIIDHSTFLSRLSTSFGVSSAALAWLKSYITNGTQTVRIGSVSSEPSICLSGVLQGSILETILFSLYIISPISQIVSDLGISHQQYADDAQPYISLKSTTADDDDELLARTSISHLETCLSTLHSWLCFNGLSVDPDKSEAILFSTHQRLRTFPATPSIHISDTEVELSDQITSLSVFMDSNLTFNAHIIVLCKACHFHLRSLWHIRRSLTDDMAILIAVVLVQSRLDYCNSLFFNMSCFNINKLQLILILKKLNSWKDVENYLIESIKI